jgi:hypothetical protein
LPFLYLLFENQGYPTVENDVPISPAVPPGLTSLNPNSGIQGTIVNVTVAGTGFPVGFLGGAPQLAISGTGVTLQNQNWTAGAATFTIDFLVNISATLGPRNVTVTTDAGTSSALTFTVGVAPTSAKKLPTFLFRR